MEERVFEVDYDGDITPFFLVDRGGCSFVKKVRNLENIGVSVVIVINDKEESIDSLVMSDDGTGGGIRIPSMIISKADGKSLIKFLERADVDELNSTAILADFYLEKPDDRVEYDFFYTSSNDKALDFLDDFQSTDGKLGELVLMTPRIVLWSCIKCEEEYINKHCLCGGRYCAMEIDKGATSDDFKGEPIPGAY